MIRKRVFIALSLTFIALLLSGCTVAQDDLASIRNFLRVNDEFCTGGQPRLEQLEKLKAARCQSRHQSSHAWRT